MIYFTSVVQVLLARRTNLRKARPNPRLARRYCARGRGPWLKARPELIYIRKKNILSTFAKAFWPVGGMGLLGRFAGIGQLDLILELDVNYRYEVIRLGCVCQLVGDFNAMPPVLLLLHHSKFG